MSGDKILAQKAKKKLNLKGTESGLEFEEFDEIPSAKKFKDGYRQAFDKMYLTDAEIERLVAGANVGFVLNIGWGAMVVKSFAKNLKIQMRSIKKRD